MEFCRYAYIKFMTAYKGVKVGVIFAAAPQRDGTFVFGMTRKYYADYANNSNCKDFILETHCIPWYEPADLAFFKAKTMGAALIMGSSTYKSIRDTGSNLLGRKIIVLSTTMKEQDDIMGEKGTMKRPIIIDGGLLAAVIAAINIAPYGKIFVIGGESLIEEAMKSGIVNKAYITLIHKDLSNIPSGTNHICILKNLSSPWMLAACKEAILTEKNNENRVVTPYVLKNAKWLSIKTALLLKYEKGGKKFEWKE